MNPGTILWLDRTAGRALCAGLTGVERVRRLFVRPPAGPPHRILFVKLVEMGSSVLACPAFDEAVRMVGRENVFILLFARNRPIIDILPQFPPTNVIAIRDTGLASFCVDLARALGRIRRERIDAAIDLEGLTRSSAAITYLTGAARRVGYYNFTSEGPYRGRLFTHEVAYGFQHHVSVMFLALVKALAAPDGQVPMLKEVVVPGALPAFEPAPREIQAVQGKLHAALGRTPDGPLVLLNPNCSDLLPLRRWPDDSFVELAQRLLADVPGSVVCLTGAPSERDGARALAARIDRPGRCVCLAGDTTLRELLALYTMADVLVTNDSGPGHFASLTPIAVVALFGPETPQLYGPLGPDKSTLSAGLACSPCVNMLNHRFSPCADNQCMKRIRVDDVYARVRALLERRAPRAGLSSGARPMAPGSTAPAGESP